MHESPLGLFGGFERRDAARLSPLVLAFVGDAVYNLYVRSVLAVSRDLTPHTLHTLLSKVVCAGAQAKAADMLLDSFSDAERDIYRRGKNARPGTVPKNADPGDYAKSSGLEAVIGYLFLTKDEVRAAELLEKACALSLEGQ